jgi:FkbM family methyltransferase
MPRPYNRAGIEPGICNVISVPRKLFFSLLRFVERLAAYGQGKGYGAATISQEIAAVATRLDSAPALAVDIGANVGEYTSALRSRFENLEIHVFEPSAVNVEKLRVRFAGDPRIRLNPVAVSGIEGTATLFSNEPGSGLASLKKRRLDHFGMRFDCAEEVHVIRFEDYWRDELASRTVDIAKLDIEGHELDALKGFGAALASTRVIQLEFGGCNIDTRTYFQDFFYFFREHAFELYRITPLGVEPIDHYREADEFFSTTNFIAVNQASRLRRQAS